MNNIQTLNCLNEMNEIDLKEKENLFVNEETLKYLDVEQFEKKI